jgi:cyanophycinase
MSITADGNAASDTTFGEGGNMLVAFRSDRGVQHYVQLAISSVVLLLAPSGAAAFAYDLTETARIGERTGATVEILPPAMLSDAARKNMKVVPQDGTVVAIGGHNSMSTDHLLANLVLQRVEGSPLDLKRDMFALTKDKLDSLRKKARVLYFTQASENSSDSKKTSAKIMFDEAGIPAANVTVVDGAMDEPMDFDSYHLIYFGGGDQNNLHALISQRVVQALHNYLNHGGMVSGTSAGAAILSRTMFAGGKEELDGTLAPDIVEMREGFGFFQAMSIDMHLFQYKRFARCLAALAQLESGNLVTTRLSKKKPIDDVVMALGQDSVAVIQAVDLSGADKQEPTGAVKVTIAGTTQTWLYQCGPNFQSDLTSLPHANDLAQVWDARLSVVPPGDWFVVKW